MLVIIETPISMVEFHEEMIIPFMIFNQNNKIVGGSRSLDLETTNYLS
jgi:hypothetical protein